MAIRSAELQLARHRAQQASLTLARVLSSGIPALDRVLPGGGWPLGGCVEVVSSLPALELVGLLLPALVPLSWEERWVALVAPPALPRGDQWAAQDFNLSRLLVVHGEATRDPLATAARGLAAGTCAAVLAWSAQVSAERWNELQAAAASGDGVMFLLRPAHDGVSDAPPGVLQVGVELSAARRTSIRLLRGVQQSLDSLELSPDLGLPPLLTGLDRGWGAGIGHSANCH